VLRPRFVRPARRSAGRLVHDRDRIVDLAGAARLLCRRVDDLADEVGDARHLRDDLLLFSELLRTRAAGAARRADAVKCSGHS